MLMGLVGSVKLGTGDGNLAVDAAQLEQHSFWTRQGGPWHAVRVKRVLERSALLGVSF